MVVCKKRWLSTYLYYYDSRDEFLIRAVYPFIKEMKSLKLFTNYFFIRYSEYGPHIRLRFNCQNTTNHEKLKKHILEYFKDYFRKNSSKKTNHVNYLIAQNINKLIANNSILFVDYIPEIERYAGPKGIRVSETQFEISSTSVLNAMTTAKRWNYEKALGMAFQMNLAFCLSVGMAREEIRDFYDLYTEKWLRAIIGNNAEVKGNKGNMIQRDLIIDQFNNLFENHEKEFRSSYDLINNAFINRQSFEEKWFNRWIKSNSMIAGKLTKYLSINQLKIGEFYRKLAERKKNKQYELFYLYDSYIHMNNNRLGLENRDEALISFFIKKSIKY